MIKVATRLASLMIVAGALVFFSNCGGDDPKPTAEEVQLGKLSSTWNIVSATLDGTTRTTDFTEFTLTISGTFNTTNPTGPYNYSVSGSRPTPSPWPANGQWSFATVGTGDTGSFLRSDDVPITYSIASNGQLTLTFDCEDCDYAGNRTKEVNGTWVFVLD